MAPFKNLLIASLVQRAGAHLQRVHPRFDAKTFTQQAQQGLDVLEMKTRRRRGAGERPRGGRGGL